MYTFSMWEQNKQNISVFESNLIHELETLETKNFHAVVHPLGSKKYHTNKLNKKIFLNKMTGKFSNKRFISRFYNK